MPIQIATYQKAPVGLIPTQHVLVATTTAKKLIGNSISLDRARPHTESDKAISDLDRI